tara:strand:+ start:271 stop:570 length:300 start_codon:yes stop_codon:yes gene_type:complete
MILSVVLLDSEIAIKWVSKKETFISFEKLRNSCPCAWCSGEKDVFGNKYVGSKKKLSKDAYKILKFEKIGLYGLRFFWGDGHSDGIYTFNLLGFSEKNG